MLDIPQTTVWGVLIGVNEEGTHCMCFGKRVGKSSRTRVIMSTKRESTHAPRCQFDSVLLKTLSLSQRHGWTLGAYHTCGELEIGLAQTFVAFQRNFPFFLFVPPTVTFEKLLRKFFHLQLCGVHNATTMQHFKSRYHGGSTRMVAGGHSRSGRLEGGMEAARRHQRKMTCDSLRD